MPRRREGRPATDMTAVAYAVIAEMPHAPAGVQRAEAARRLGRDIPVGVVYGCRSRRFKAGRRRMMAATAPPERPTLNEVFISTLSADAKRSGRLPCL